MDEPVTIQVSDLDPGQPVTMATKLEEGGDTYVAHAFYAADDGGRVDLTHSTSTGGSYIGELMGGISLWFNLVNVEPGMSRRPHWYPAVLAPRYHWENTIIKSMLLNNNDHFENGLLICWPRNRKLALKNLVTIIEFVPADEVGRGHDGESASSRPSSFRPLPGKVIAQPSSNLVYTLDGWVFRTD